jgi:hypothetical protein
LEPRSYRREFLRSAHHAALGILTLGAGLVAGPEHPWALLVGATLYVLGWIYLPDMPLFRRSVEKKRQASERAREESQAKALRARNAQVLESLSPSRRERYVALVAVCKDIERASAELAMQSDESSPLAAGDPNTDLRLYKLEELVWTFLRLLSIEEAQERFLEAERRENLPRALEQVEEEGRRLQAECDELRKAGSGSRLDAKMRLLESCHERRDVLQKRVERVETTREHVALVGSELERLVQQVKLIRADAMATKNAAGLSARIDATIEHLDETNRWLAGLEEFRDLVGEPLGPPVRVGFDLAPGQVPPLPTQRTRGANRAEERG